MLIYRLLSYFAYLSVAICFLAFVGCVWKGIELHKYGRFIFSDWIYEIKEDVNNIAGSKSKIFLIAALISILATSSTLHQAVGIHNLNLKPEGSYCFFVDIYDYNGRLQTLPAEINVVTETDDATDEKSRSKTYFFVDKVIWGNGTTIDFIQDEPIKLGEFYSCFDSNGNEWNLRIVNVHAYSPYVKETNNATWLHILLLLLEVVPVVFCLYVTTKKQL